MGGRPRRATGAPVRVLPGSTCGVVPFGRGVRQMLNNSHGPTLFLKDPRTPLHNNAAERALRGSRRRPQERPLKSLAPRSQGGCDPLRPHRVPERAKVEERLPAPRCRPRFFDPAPSPFPLRRPPSHLCARVLRTGQGEVLLARARVNPACGIRLRELSLRQLTSLAQRLCQHASSVPWLRSLLTGSKTDPSEKTRRAV